nr:RHS repeat-associated core domain-containing protein [Shewanella sp. NIFS-20-20]
MHSAINEYVFSKDSDGIYRKTAETVSERTSQYGSDGVMRELIGTETTSELDDWGNVTRTVTDITNLSSGQLESRVETLSQYQGAGGGEAKGRLSSTIVTKSRFGQREFANDIETSSSFSYYPNGLLHTSTVSPNDNRYKLATTKTYDAFGNTLTESVTGGIDAGGATQQTRQTRYQYDTRGRHLKSVTNSLGDTSTYTYNGQSADVVTGNITKVTVTDANSRALTKEYDDWGRLVREVTPDGVPTTYRYANCGADCQPFNGGRLLTAKQKAGTPDSQVVVDKYGREIGKKVRGFDGRWIVSGTDYDAQGRPVRHYEPAFDSLSPYFTALTYDTLGRVTQQTNPNDGVSATQFLGFETLTLDPNGKQKRSISNAVGEPHRVIDDIGNELEFVYNAGGNLSHSYITTASGQETLRSSATFDAYGRKTSTFDTDKSQWLYTYNAFGEMLSQTSGKNQSRFMYYDSLGRKIRQTAPDGTSCWAYGNRSNRTAGQLISETRYDSVVSDCSAGDWAHRKQLGYDNAGRVATTTTTQGGISYTHRFTYDSQGRLHTQQYPNNLLTVMNHYNSQGYLFKRTDQQTSKAYQTITDMNARGQVEAVTYGNGAQESTVFEEQTGWVNSITLSTNGVTAHQLDYRFDTVGNLEWRQHALSSAPATFSENYHYDDLYRLYERTINIHAGGTSLPNDFKSTHTIDYDDLGNITAKSGTGEYTYDANNPYRLASIGTTRTVAAVKSCPAGYSLNSAQTSCIKSETRAATAVCPAGYSWNGSTCQKQLSVAATAVCPSGYLWNGTTCTQNQNTAATPVCASGYSWTGTTCQKVVTTNATPTCQFGYTYNSSTRRCEKQVTTSASKSCPSGYSYSGSLDKCINVLTTSASWVCTGGGGGGEDPRLAPRQSCFWQCPPGYSNVGPSRETCEKTLVANYTYSCPTGSTLSGATCSTLATTTNSWSCPTGSTLSGTSCQQIVTQSNSWSCPAGSTMSGDRCNKLLTANPTWSCPANTTLSGTTCNGTLTASPSSWSCPSGWSVSGSSCHRQLTAAVTLSCPVGSLSGSNCLITDSPTHTMTYDGNGNITYDGSRRFTYNSDDKVTLITRGNEQTRFKYDAGQQRYERYDVKVEGGVTTYLTTQYVGGYEKVTRTGGGKPTLTEQKLYVGNLVITKRSNNTQDEYYLHKDHQGSTTTITNQHGNVVQQFTYDPWGKQTAAYRHSILNDYIAPAASKGYTGHEGVDHLNIIHMNGRIYDPTIGRFLQADPHIQDPGNSQSFNRYAYVLNNPMSYTDPSGFFFKKIGDFFKKFWRPIVAIVASIVTYGAATGWAAGLLTGTSLAGSQVAIGAIAGGISGFVGGGIATGSLRGAFKGALSGAVFGAIGGAFKGTPYNNGAAHIGSHAVAGGVIAELQGGNFGHGFLQAGILKGIGIVNGAADGANYGEIASRAGIQAIVGGTFSKITGGKFADGAMFAALQYVVNAQSSNIQRGWESFKSNAGRLWSDFKGYWGNAASSDIYAGAYAVVNSPLKNLPDDQGIKFGGCAGIHYGGCAQIVATNQGLTFSKGVGMVYGVSGGANYIFQNASSTDGAWAWESSVTALFVTTGVEMNMLPGAQLQTGLEMGTTWGFSINNVLMKHTNFNGK